MELIKNLGIDWAWIPGGCTGHLQGLDTHIKNPFKGKLKVLYPDLMRNGEKMFTKRGNMRAPSFEKLCDMIIEAMDHIKEDIVKNYFIQTGQTKDSTPDQISHMTEGRGLHHVYQALKDIWDLEELDSDELILDLDVFEEENPDDLVLNEEDITERDTDLPAQTLNFDEVFIVGKTPSSKDSTAIDTPKCNKNYIDDTGALRLSDDEDELKAFTFQ